jgi:hypothetical protein
MMQGLSLGQRCSLGRPVAAHQMKSPGARLDRLQNHQVAAQAAESQMIKRGVMRIHQRKNIIPEATGQCSGAQSCAIDNHAGLTM